MRERSRRAGHARRRSGPGGPGARTATGRSLHASDRPTEGAYRVQGGSRKIRQATGQCQVCHRQHLSRFLQNSQKTGSIRPRLAVSVGLEFGFSFAHAKEASMQSLKNWFVLVAVSLFLAACSSSGDPEQVAQAFTRAAYAGDVDKLMELIDTPANAQANQKDMVRGKLQMMVAATSALAAQKGGVDKIETGKVSYNEDKTIATVPVTVLFENDEKTTDSVRLVKVDG